MHVGAAGGLLGGQEQAAIRRHDGCAALVDPRPPGRRRLCHRSSPQRRRGIAVESIADDVPDGPHGRLIEAIIDWKNAQFLEDLSRDVRRGLHDLARQGYAPGGFPPRGYTVHQVQIGTRNNGTARYASEWVVDEQTAPLVRKAFEMRAQGASYREIHEATHIFPAKGSYGSMLCNRTYLGVRKCGDLEIPGAHEAIVTQELFDAVQARFQPRAPKGGSRPGYRRRKTAYLLSGMGRCAYCNSAMAGSSANVHTRPNPWPYYLCGRKKRRGYHTCEGQMINAKSAERAVIEAVIGRILSPTHIENLVEAVNNYLDRDMVDVDLQIDQVNAKLLEACQAIERLLDLAERFGADAAGERLLKREAEKKALEKELHRLQLLRQQSRIEVSPAAVVNVLASAWDNLTEDDVAARRAFLRQFVDRIEMGNEEGTLYYTFPLEILDPTLLITVPPRECEPQDCLLEYLSA